MYGAGEVGQWYLEQLQLSGYAEVIAIVDQDWAKYSQMSVPIFAPECLSVLSFDMILVSIEKRDIADSVVKILEDKYGINQSKIIIGSDSLCTVPEFIKPCNGEPFVVRQAVKNVRKGDLLPVKEIGMKKNEKKESVAVFGLSEKFNQYYSEIERQFNILALIDDAGGKLGSNLYGYKVASINDFDFESVDKVLITINDYETVITKVLEKVNEDKIITLDSMGVYSDKILRIAFILSSNYTDVFLGVNYICAFRNKLLLPQDCIDIFVDENLFSFMSLFNLDNNTRILVKKNFQDKPYHFCIKLDRYPKLEKTDMNAAKHSSEYLVDYFLACQKFELYNRRYLNEKIRTNGASVVVEEAQGKKRIQQPDIYNYLKITEEPFLELNYLENNNDILGRMGIEYKSYITVDMMNCYEDKIETMGWPKKCYKELIEGISIKFPNLPIVIISRETIKINKENIILYKFDGVFGRWADIVRGSILHITTDNVSAHIRHFYDKGRSIVLFGPTSPQFYGYTENINIRGVGCTHWCEDVEQNWKDKCVLGDDTPRCMESITPKYVLKYVEEVLRADK